MLDTYKHDTHVHENINIKMPEIPTKYDVYNHNKNDDVERMDFYLRNNIPSGAMQNDLLREVIGEISNKVNEHMMRHYDGKEKSIKITVKDSFKYTVLSMPDSRYALLDKLSLSIKERYNVNNRILISEDFLDGSMTIIVNLLDRVTE